MEKFIDLAAKRYSQRRFNDNQIESEKLDQILESARLAPTAANKQPQRIKVITKADDLAKVDACTPCRFGAPTVLLICYDKNETWKREFDGACSGEVDASIITTHMMFAAEELGLGSCWVMHFDPQKTIELFDLQAHIVPVAMLPIGYPAENARPSKLHTDRKPISDYLLD